MEKNFGVVPSTIDATESLVDNIEMRNKLIGRVDVLDKGNQLDVVRDDEWPALIEVASSICRNAGLDVVQIANETNAEVYALSDS